MCDSGFRDASTEEVMAIVRRNAEKWRGTLDLLAQYDQDWVTDEQMPREETLKRFEALNPEESGPKVG